MQRYGFSIVFSIVCLALSGWWGYSQGSGILTALWLTVVLGTLEVSLSFDNAIVNATVLRRMDAFWQKMFLTVGILIAVFGMRLVFPVVIVSVMTDLGTMAVIDLALNDPAGYGQVLTDAYPMIAAFGGSFLLMVFLEFAFDVKRDTHWLGAFERHMASAGRLKSIEILVALASITFTAMSMEPELRFDVMLAGVSGVMLFVVISSLDDLFRIEDDDNQSIAGQGAAVAAARSGFMAFMYLEVLDASFSFDGVIGAFAITRDIVVIMLGLAIGAIFVRSITIDLVKRGTLERYIFLEHGAMYAIGVLALIMFIGTRHHVPEVLTGFIGISFIGLSFWSSIKHAKARCSES